MKRLITKALMFILIFNMFAFSSGTYGASKLTDIESHWSKVYVQRLVNSNAISGYPDGTFRPNGSISRSAFITVLAKALELTPSDSNYFEDTQTHWAQKYISAAVDAGILVVDDYSVKNQSGVLLEYGFKPDQNMTREEMAQIITRALGEEYNAYHTTTSKFTDQAKINPKLIGYVAIASINGIITGYPDGRFSPTSSATRAEACVMITKLLDQLDAKPKMNEMDSEDIYSSYAKAVVTITGTDEDGDKASLASGFIVTKTGKVITNYHVISGMSDLEVTFTDGKTKKVESIHNYDRDYDVAVLNLEAGLYDMVSIGNSRRLNIGEKIYTVGYPLVMKLSISDGLVSSKLNEDGHNYIQISAPISPGSSGGALVDKYGRVVGITSAGYEGYGAQNMNLAIPICDVINLLISADEKIDIKSATEYEIDLTDASINGQVKAFEVFATNDLDMKEVVYDETVSISDYSYIGYSVELKHNAKVKNNSLDAMIKITDYYGYPAAYTDYFMQRIHKGTKTIYNAIISTTDIEELGPGAYTIELYLSGELVASDWITLKSDATYESYGPISTRIQTFDYDTFSLSDKKTVNPMTVFQKNSTTAVGFSIDANFSKPAETYTSIVYDITIESTDGYYEKFDAVGILSEGDREFGFYTGYGFIPGEFPIGNYTAAISYGEKVLNTTQFQVIEGMEGQIVSQQLKIDYFVDPISETIIKTPVISDWYDIVVPIQIGNVTKDSVIEAHYKIRSSNTVTNDTDEEITEEKFYISKEDSNSSYEMIFKYVSLDAKQRSDYVNGEDIFIDIYINGKLFSSIPYELTIPDVTYKLLDSFIFASPYKDYDAFKYYETPYNNFKLLEKKTIDLSDNSCLYTCFYVAAKPFDEYSILIDYLRIELIRKDTGAIVYTVTENYVSLNEATGKESLMILKDLHDGSIVPGVYTLNVYTEKNGNSALSTEYTFVE